MSERSRDYWVGMFVLAGLGVLGGLTLIYGENPTLLFFKTKWTLHILVDNPTGIGEGTPAFMQGVQIGRVLEIRLQNPERPSDGANVVVEVDDEYAIPRGSKAKIHARFGFDKGAIHVHPPEVLGRPLSKDGTASIKGEMVGAFEAIVPEEFIKNLVKAVEEIANVGDKVGDVLRRAGVVLDDVHHILEIRRKEDVDDPQQDMPANLFTAIQRADETLKLVNDLLAEKGDLRVSVADLRTSAGHIRDWTEKLDGRTERLVTKIEDTTATFERRMGDVATALVDAAGRLSKVLDEAHATLTAVNEGQGAVGKAIYDPKLYEELVDTLDQLQLLIQETRAAFVWLRTESKIK